ncbi:unnamed protein product [Victoria cruziana]
MLTFGHSIFLVHKRRRNIAG